MVAKLHCMACPDEAFAPQAPGAGGSSARGPTSSTHKPIHYGDVTARTPLPSGSGTKKFFLKEKKNKEGEQRAAHDVS